MSTPRITYSFFFDCHTSVYSTPFGDQFSAEKFIGQLKSCGVDFLTCHARCNQGHAYYNTQIGKRHPGLSFDLLKELCKEAKRNGITFSAYFNAKLSEEELIEHPEWNEQPFAPANRDHNGPFYRRGCFNTGYGDHLLAMALEVAKNYPVDGFFFDCMVPSDCICPKCVKAMRDLQLDPTNLDDVRHFNIESSNAMVKRLHDEIKAVLPGALLFFNGRPFSVVKDFESHFEAECLPTGAWGYECLPILTHYLPNLAQGKTIVNMTGRFNEWGDFGGLRTKEGLEYDMFYGLAHGMRPDISDAILPSYQWPQAVVDRVKEVYDAVRPYDPWCLDAYQNPEVALVGQHTEWEAYPCSPATEASVRMMTELKIPFDLVTIHTDWSKYNLLIFPDEIVFTDEITARVRAHLARGGKVIASGHSGLIPTGDAFALEDAWPARYISEYPFNSAVYYQPEGAYSERLPQIPMALYAKGLNVSLTDNARATMYYVEPYIQGGWDGLHVNFYKPPKEKTSMPFLMQKGNIAYISGHLFEGYQKLAPVQHRYLLENILKAFLPQPQMRISKLPSFGRAFMQFRPNGQILVHVMAYCPERRCGSTAIEDRLEIHGTQLEVRLDGKSVQKVYLAPDRQPLEYSITDEGYCRIHIPYFCAYTLVVIE